MNIQEVLKKFLFPKPTPKYLLRLGIIAVSAFIFFKWICIPARIHGRSMEPTYRDGGFNFCWRPAYLFSKPKKSDIVMVRFAGNKVMLLKRIVALENETVEFKNGKLFINAEEANEPYVKYSCDWNLPPRKVEKGSVYVIGDNRDMSIEEHLCGQTSLKRVAGKPLW